MWPNSQFPADLVTSTGEIFNGKFYFLCSKRYRVTKTKQLVAAVILWQRIQKFTDNSYLWIKSVEGERNRERKYPRCYTQMTFTLKRVGYERKNEVLLDVGRLGRSSECSGCQIFTFLLKKLGFAPWPGIMLSQTLIYYWQEIFLLNLMSDSEAIL